MAEKGSLSPNQCEVRRYKPRHDRAGMGIATRVVEAPGQMGTGDPPRIAEEILICVRQPVRSWQRKVSPYSAA